LPLDSLFHQPSHWTWAQNTCSNFMMLSSIFVCLFFLIYGSLFCMHIANASLFSLTTWLPNYSTIHFFMSCSSIFSPHTSYNILMIAPISFPNHMLPSLLPALLLLLSAEETTWYNIQYTIVSKSLKYNVSFNWRKFQLLMSPVDIIISNQMDDIFILT
jgi:hypothetical protein